MVCSKHVAQTMSQTIRVREHNGRCLIRFRCPDKGKDVSKTFGAFNDATQKHQADGVAIDITKALANGSWTGSIDNYLPKEVKAKVKPLIELLKAKVGDKKNGAEQTVLKLLLKQHPFTRPSDVKKWLDGLDVKNSTKNRYRGVINAVRPDLCEGVGKYKENKPVPQPWESEQKEAICNAMKGGVWEHYIWGLFLTGMRHGEFRAITPADFKKNSKSFYVEVNKVITKEGHKPCTKTNQDRVVPMHEHDWSRLKSAVEAHHEVWASHREDYFRKSVWKPAIKTLGFKPRTPYSTRSTAISEFLQKGGSYLQAGKVFGNSGATIEKSYAGIVGQLMPVGGAVGS
jgi:integrase